MEELVDVLNKIEKTIEINNNFIHSAIIPFLIGLIPTILIIIQNCMYNRQNKKIQFQIQKRDEKLKLYDNILEIYNTYAEVLYKMNSIVAEDNFYVIYANDQLTLKNDIRLLQSVYDFSEYSKKLFKEYNKAKLLFNNSDKELLNRLEKLNLLYNDFMNVSLNYFSNGENFKVADEAWERIITIYPEITKGNIQQLHINMEAKKLMETMCIGEKAKKLQDISNDYIKHMEYDEFDKYFEQYLQIK